ncbi:hypothetical protein H8D83_00815 [Candidatus Woesearchaeota archaeon]|nr:hypothetical protein [Candidatus Woesearchaeota archaeon]MBL7050774.1 hypothetical protein [Candidatus Woesearchaeota archaeon]
MSFQDKITLFKDCCFLSIKHAVSGFGPMRSQVRIMTGLGGYEPWRDEYDCGPRWNIKGYNSSTKR